MRNSATIQCIDPGENPKCQGRFSIVPKEEEEAEMPRGIKVSASVLCNILAMKLVIFEGGEENVALLAVLIYKSRQGRKETFEIFPIESSGISGDSMVECRAGGKPLEKKAAERSIC